jgi:hypothetical protein
MEIQERGCKFKSKGAISIQIFRCVKKAKLEQRCQKWKLWNLDRSLLFGSLELERQCAGSMAFTSCHRTGKSMEGQHTNMKMTQLPYGAVILEQEGGVLK